MSIELKTLSKGIGTVKQFLNDDVLLPKLDQGQGSKKPVILAPARAVWVIKGTEI